MRETEAKCERILKLERSWHDLRGEIKQQAANVGELEYIKRPLKKSEIDSVAGIIKTLTDNMEKSGFLHHLPICQV